MTSPWSGAGRPVSAPPSFSAARGPRRRHRRRSAAEAPPRICRGSSSGTGCDRADLLALREKKSAGLGVEIIEDEVVAIVEPVLTLASLPGAARSPRDGSSHDRRCVDELTDIPGARERWGRDFLPPYCHGWEVRDQAKISVLGTDPGHPPGTPAPAPMVGRHRLLLGST